jgi:hypothetical protein
MQARRRRIGTATLALRTLEALEQLRALDEWASSIHTLAAEHALLANAVILYARATVTDGRTGERGATSVRDRLCSDEQITHDWIIGVRNTALAHVRANHPISDDLWHREIVFAVEQSGGAWLPAAMTRRVQSNPKLAAELRRLLVTADRLLRDTYHKRIEYVAKLLEDTSGVADAFPLALLNPVEVFGSEREAPAALTGQEPGGRTAGIIDR